MTPRQLGITVREKSVIDCLHNFGVISSYVDIMLINASGAHAGARSQEFIVISSSSANGS